MGWASRVAAMMSVLAAACSTAAPALELDALDPDEAYAHTATAATLSGRGFVGRASAQLEGTSPPRIDSTWRVRLGDVEALDVVRRSDEALELLVPEGMALGRHDVTATAPDGREARLPGGLLILAEPLADAGPADAGIDAGLPDAGFDAGPPDAGPPDAGPPDAGPPDAGPPDAGPPDAGRDSGSVDPPTSCGGPSCTFCQPVCTLASRCECFRCDCAMRCDDALGCDAECWQEGTSCSLDARGNGMLTFECRAGALCSVDARGAASVSVECGANAECDIDCEGATVCQATCGDEANCVLRCAGSVSCGFSFCSAGQAACPSGVVVCGADCP